MARVLISSLVLVLFCLSGAAEPPAYPDKQNLLIYRDADGTSYPVKTPDDWAKRRAHILAHAQSVMGPFPDRKPVPLDVRIEEESEHPDHVRRKITLAGDDGDRIVAYLLLPKPLKKNHPAVVCLHPTHRELGAKTVIGEHPKSDRHYALHLVKRGYVTIAPDYVNMGEYRFHPYDNDYVSATMKGILNHMRCVDLLVSMPEVDAHHIGTIGHSLGGHNSIFLGVFDERIKCVISSCGFCSFPRYYGGNLTGWSHDGYMPRIKTEYDLDPEKMPFDFPELVAALAPRPFLAVAPEKDHNFDVEGVRDCVKSAALVYNLLGVKSHLRAIYPDAGHDFPDEARRTAYDWLDWHLKPE